MIHADLAIDDRVILWLIVAFSLMAFIVSLFNRLKLEHLEHQFNSRVDQLVRAGEARGRLAGRTERALPPKEP